MSSKLVPSVASTSQAMAGSSSFPPAARMLYEVLRDLPPNAQPTTTDLWHAVHARYPSPPAGSPEAGSSPRPLGSPKPIKPGMERPFPNHPLGSKSQFKKGFLLKLKEARLLQLAYVKPVDIGAGLAQSRQQLGTYYWRFHPGFGAPTERETDAISPKWREAFEKIQPALPAPLRVGARIAHWSSVPLPRSEDNNARKPFIPGKFGLPSPVIRKGKPALTERETIVKELKKYQVLNRQKLRLLPDRILRFRKWEAEVAAKWNEEGADGVLAMFREAEARRAERRQRALERLGFDPETESLDMFLSDVSEPALAVARPLAGSGYARENIRRAIAALNEASEELEVQREAMQGASASDFLARTKIDVAGLEDRVAKLQDEVEDLYADLPAAEAEEHKAHVVKRQYEFRQAGALAKDQLDQAARRARNAEERRIEAMQMEAEQQARLAREREAQLKHE